MKEQKGSDIYEHNGKQGHLIDTGTDVGSSCWKAHHDLATKIAQALERFSFWCGVFSLAEFYQTITSICCGCFCYFLVYDPKQDIIFMARK